MSDDIETLSTFVDDYYSHDDGGKVRAALERLVADRDRLQGRVGTLQKALDDRHAADVKAWKPIMNAAGRERGLPSNTEVVAFYVAEVERLEKELAAMSLQWDAALNGENFMLKQRDSLRAKLERAKEIIRPFSDERNDGDHLWNATGSDFKRARAFYLELSADAPAQQTQISDEVREATEIKQHDGYWAIKITDVDGHGYIKLPEWIGKILDRFSPSPNSGA
jgi:hypothetical protein